MTRAREMNDTKTVIADFKRDWQELVRIMNSNYNLLVNDYADFAGKIDDDSIAFVVGWFLGVATTIFWGLLIYYALNT